MADIRAGRIAELIEPLRVKPGSEDGVELRIDVPGRNWKFSAADVRERARWDDYQLAADPYAEKSKRAQKT
jgi:hypothetical protein